MDKIIAFCATLILCTALVSAQPYTVDNNSFELPGTVKIKGWNGEVGADIPGWASDTQAADSGVEIPTVGAANDGDWIAFLMRNDPTVYQLTSHTIAAGEGYLLLVDGRATSGGAGANLQLQMDLYYDNAGARTQMATTTVTVMDRVDPYPWGTYQLSLSAADVPAAAIGNQIGIEFDNVSTDNSWIGIDNVRLIPEPISLALLGIGGLGFLRRRKR